MRTHVPLLVLGFLLVSCGTDEPTGPPNVASVEVTATTQTLTALGQTVQLRAAAKAAGGSPISGKSFTWGSSDAAVATITDAGLATAVGNGTATITAATDGVSSSLSVTVEQAPSQLAIRTLPDGATSGQPLTTQPVLEVHDANGNVVTIDNATNVTASLGGGGMLGGSTSVTAAQGVATFVDLVVSGLVGNRTLTFSATGIPSVSSDSFDLAPGTPNALLLAGGDGQTGVVGTALTDLLGVLATDEAGNPVSGHQITWSVAAGSGSIAAVSGTTDVQGLGKAVWMLGTMAADQTATAASGLGTVTFTATGTPDVPAAVTLTPASVELMSLGAERQLSASVSDQYGNAITSLTLVWTTSDPLVAVVDAGGLITSTGGGSASISATADGAVGSINLLVRNPLCVAPPLPSPGGAAGTPGFGVEFVGTLAFPYVTVGAITIDLGGDGIDDFVVLSAGDQVESVRGGAMFAYRNDGTGRYQRDSLDIPFEAFDSPMQMVVMDVNGDGLDDLYVPNQGPDFFPNIGAKNALLIQQTDGTLVEVGATNFVPYINRETFRVVPGDVDCDGDVDVVEVSGFTTTADGLSTLSRSEWAMMINDGSGVFTREQSRLPDAVHAANAEALLSWAYFCDVNRDGAPDLIGGHAQNGVSFRRAQLYVNDGFGNFRTTPEGTIPDTLAILSGPPGACVDVDLDGWPDLIELAGSPVGSTPVRLVVLYHNNGDGTFSEITAAAMPQTWPLEFEPIGPFVVDLNSDGWPDFFAAGAGPNFTSLCSLYLNQGDGSFVLIEPLFAGVPYPGDCGNIQYFQTQANADGRVDLIGISNGLPPWLYRIIP